jgi:hypothetical protein
MELKAMRRRAIAQAGTRTVPRVAILLAASFTFLMA